MLNDLQKEVVNTVEGPVLVVAGPGTGKTHTLVNRLVHMVEDCHILPSEIILSTFTNKAAQELISRLSEEFKGKNIDISGLTIGNFHSIAQKILDRYLDKTYLKPGYKLIDETEGAYLIYKHLDSFRRIRGYEKTLSGVNEVKNIAKIRSYIKENLIDETKMYGDEDLDTLVNISKTYGEILKSNNLCDFSNLLFLCYDILSNNHEVLEEVRKYCKYIMIDEYQDTNRIQEAIIFLLGGEEENICVVGDDDQGLYRFRGANVRNLLDFDKKTKKPVKRVFLLENYRSDEKIIGFYNSFMRNKKIVDFGKNRFEKNIIPSNWKRSNPNAVSLIMGKDEEEWAKMIYSSLENLIRIGNLKDYNQVAILFSSLNHERAIFLKRYFKSKGIGVYTPKENSLLSKKEIRELIGALLYIYQDEVEKLHKAGEFKTSISFIKACVGKIKNFKDEEFETFLSSIKQDDKLDILGLIYKLLAFEPFYTYANSDEKDKIKNISRFMDLEKSHSLMSGKFSTSYELAKSFFSDFLAFLKDQRVKEYEEDTDFPPEGNVSFLTIHMSKGMEYPLVLIGSTWDYPYMTRYKTRLDKSFDKFANLYELRDVREDESMINRYDFARKYYTAFSRAKNLLLFAGIEGDRGMSFEFREALKKIKSPSMKELKSLNFDRIKNPKIKNEYSYTTDILTYSICPRRYKFIRKYNFREFENIYEDFGSFIHGIMEKLNKKIIWAKLIGEDLDFVYEDIYRQIPSIIEAEAKNTGFKSQLEKIHQAFSIVDRYARKNKSILLGALQSEREVFLSMGDFIFKGNIDLITESEENKLGILDYKTGKVPAHGKHPHLEQYKEQVGIYKYIYQQISNRNIDKTLLYFTNDEADNIFELNIGQAYVDQLVKNIESIVGHIEKGEFDAVTLDRKNCMRCPMKYFCMKKTDLLN